MHYPAKIDLHMHSTVSDGTDTPEQLLQNVKQNGLSLFSLTDHDTDDGCQTIRNLLKEGDPLFLNGIEFACQDEKGKYHILGYDFDSQNETLRRTIATGHQYRMNKAIGRLQFLEKTFGFCFPEEEKKRLLSLNNPGKPHIANLMVQYGFAPNRAEAIRQYINPFHPDNQYLRPEQAIEAVLLAGGIPILAHPVYGNGEQHITGTALRERFRYLIAYGLQGVEAFYTGLSPALTQEVLDLAQQYDLYVTAGSDYHGTNKTVLLGSVPLPNPSEYPQGLKNFLSRIYHP